MKHPLLRTAPLNTGTASITFLLSFPVFLVIVGILVQYALAVNAQITVNHAARVAARTAATALPDLQSQADPENPPTQSPQTAVLSAACMALAPISPQAQSETDAQATAISTALSACGVPVTDTFASRYTYALQATTVSWTPDTGDFLHEKGQQLQVTVKYRFYLTVPGASKLLNYVDGPVAGVDGRFYDLTATAAVQTAHGRQTATDNTGSPQ